MVLKLDFNNVLFLFFLNLHQLSHLKEAGFHHCTDLTIRSKAAVHPKTKVCDSRLSILCHRVSPTGDIRNKNNHLLKFKT